MKATIIIAISFLCFSGLGLAQEGMMKTIGGAAKEKVKSQDFNSTRSNKEKGMLQNERKSSPAPASAPEPDTTTPREPVTPAFGQGAQYDQSYTFGQKLVYEMEELNDSKDDKTSTTYYYGSGANMVVNGGSDMVTIADFTHESAITFDEKNKTATVFSTHWATQMAAKYAKDSDATITRTGNTKQILGYNCEEYIVQDKKNKYVQWVTSDIKLDYSKAMAAMVKNMNLKVDGTDYSEQTLLMEMTSYDKKGAPEFHMILTEYKEESVVKALAGYSVSVL